MENNQPRKKNAGVTALIAMLLIITTLASCIGLYAWAKYITNKNGRATVDVAKWNFNLSLRAGQNTVTTPTQTLDLATTTYQNLANDRIAPGTSGEFDIVINTQGTEVSLNYDVTIAITDCPRNITFSRQQGTDASTLETVSAGGTDTFARTIHFSKYVPVANASGEFVEKIKWNWPYEGGNDTWDTQDQGKTTRLAITVVGTEVLSDPNAGGNQPAADSVQAQAQAGAINRWDSVNYNPGDGSISNNDLTLAGASLIGDTKVANIAGASLLGTINASSASDWVVLDVNQTTGEVKIIPRTYSTTTLQLSGKDGYNNAIEAINQVAEIYENTEFAEEGKTRSLTVEDVNKVENHTPNGLNTQYSWNHIYTMDENLNIIENSHIEQVWVEETEQVWVPDESATETASESESSSGHYEERVVGGHYEDRTIGNVATYTSTEKTGSYSYSLNNFIKSTNNINMRCWLASRCVSLYSNSCDFSVRNLNNGNVNNDYLFYVGSNGNTGGISGSYPVVPVVTLKSTVKMEKDSNSVWQLNL